MCKATPIQYNGVDVTPEATLQFKEGGRLQFKDRHTMQHMALDLGYPFYLFDGVIYSAENEVVKVANAVDVFQAALPMCKGKAIAAKSPQSTKSIAIVAI